MFASLKEQPADKILALMQEFKQDPRPNKIDLGVGVYKNSEGVTPIMGSVKAAEKILCDIQETKVYVGLAGDPAFSEAMVNLVLGNVISMDKISAVATPGGTGAVRQAFELIRLANRNARIFVSDPTWPNHLSILEYLKIPFVNYRYFNKSTGDINFSGMLEDLTQMKLGDVVLLHGCCHNPSGANLNHTQWRKVVDLISQTGATPMVDIAYQGFGDGLEEDAEATRMLVSSLPEVIIAASCSKNFGIYRERTGILITTSQDKCTKVISQGNMAFLNRQNFSFPPDHGARVVTMILNNSKLRVDWEKELNDIRLTMLDLRRCLADELKDVSGSDRFEFLARHRGMFSRLGGSETKVKEIREKHAVYMVGDSRINIAGLTQKTIPILARAIVDCQF